MMREEHIPVPGQGARKGGGRPKKNRLLSHTHSKSGGSMCVGTVSRRKILSKSALA